MFGQGRLGLKIGTPQQVSYNGYFNSNLGVGVGTKMTNKVKIPKRITWSFSTPFDGHIVSENVSNE
jgi:hypothetical protein